MTFWKADTADLDPGVLETGAFFDFDIEFEFEVLVALISREKGIVGDFVFHGAPDDHVIASGPPFFVTLADVPASECFTVEE